MLLSRFWYLLMAMATAAAFAGMMLVQATFNRQYRQQLEDALQRDALEVELLLKVDARSQIAAIAPIAADEDVRRALSDPRSPKAALVTRLRELNGKLAELEGELLLALNEQGEIVASVGTDEVPDGAGLGGFPAVERALRGYLRDDVWVLDDSAYRIAARPVISDRRYAGAIVHGKKIDDGLARKLAERIGDATVAFFEGDKILAAHVPSVTGGAAREAVRSALPDLSEKEDALAKGEAVVEALEGGAVGIFASITGSAAHAKVGYAIARPARILATPWEIFDFTSGEDAQNLDWILLGAIALSLFLVGMLFVWLEHTRPVGAFTRAARDLENAPTPKLDVAGFSGSFRRAAESVNAALERVAAAAGSTARDPLKSANLDEILGPTPGPAAAAPAAFFGFADAEPAAKTPTPLPSAPRTPAGAASPMMAAPPPPPVPAPSRLEAALPSQTTGAGIDTAPPPPSSPFDLEGDEEEDEATRITAVPEELLAAATARAAKPTPVRAPSAQRQPNRPPEERADPDEHFREVYGAFVATKRECGESIAGLTFDKFSATLRRNREQIIAKHGADSVRFSVYVRDGKAAIKATPVRSA